MKKNIILNSLDQYFSESKEISKDVFDNPGEAMKRAEELGLTKIHTHKDKDGSTVFMPGTTHEDYKKAVAYGLPPEVVERELNKPHAHKEHKSGFDKVAPKPEWKSKKKGPKYTSFLPDHQVTAPPTMTWEGADDDTNAAEYQGKKVELNKPFRTPDESKKFAVYVKNDKGNVVIVRFGDPDMEIKRDDPERLKNFRARHNCDDPGPKWKARYWSCRFWEKNVSVTELLN